ncbi:LysR family transcriptional regulator [Thalassotalea euphylliae]|uniref:LysR family transcriptional regulator n=1 Tax=Thalassotalea euphylliae TaxID=1655234 RepID=A0A3E0TQD4_9GAMM|nr:LysR substrate-binding domain-containing protein [Thalassotalea euphylliae]REL26252.1 LysR family transcriptional regulator [Thalassotalea euphylliae]
MYKSPITLEALLVLDAIDNRGSFAAAAEQLNKVPSALSYIVQKLEEQLSITLFVRQGRRSVLTPAGRHLLEEGRKVLGAVSKISEQAQTIAHGWEPKFRIGIDSIVDNQPLMEVLAKFLSDYPNVEVDISEHVMSGTWEALQEDRVDMVIGAPSPVPNHQGIRTVALGSLSQVLVAAPNHPISRLPSPVTKADIEDYRTIIVHDSARNAVPWTSNVIEQSQHFYVTSVSQKIAAIQAGIGVGFLPKARVAHLLADKVVSVIPTETPPIEAVFYMAWKVVNKGKGLQALVSQITESHYYAEKSG